MRTGRIRNAAGRPRRRDNRHPRRGEPAACAAIRDLPAAVMVMKSEGSWNRSVVIKLGCVERFDLPRKLDAKQAAAAIGDVPSGTPRRLDPESQRLVQRKVVSRPGHIGPKRNEIVSVIQKIPRDGATADVVAGIANLGLVSIVQVSR